MILTKSDGVDVSAKYLLFDGTYFNKKSCLTLFFNAETKKPILYSYIEKESYHKVLPLLEKLKAEGVKPVSITIDGHKQIIKALL